METIIFGTAAILGFRRLQSYMLPCLYALLVCVSSQKLLKIALFSYSGSHVKGQLIQASLSCSVPVGGVPDQPITAQPG